MDDKSLHQLHNEEINQKDGFKEVNNPDYYLGKKFYPSCQYLEWYGIRVKWYKSLLWQDFK